ncbi:hypothetical protein KCMC57_up16830 [Kitasatospora sp. CMC57]|uniref:Uncharacterized protein n=1 Tax=Kitasatospora sp. CMC57 TaxID=3231513 RepID=A0AB33JYA9_9ACTN
MVVTDRQFDSVPAKINPRRNGCSQDPLRAPIHSLTSPVGSRQALRNGTVRPVPRTESVRGTGRTW